MWNAHETMNDRARVRLRGRLLVGAVLVTVAFGVAYSRLRSESGFIVGLVPLSDREALVLARANYDTGPARGWITRTRSDGRRRWTTELPGPPDAVGSRHGVAVDSRNVVVTTGDGVDRSSIVAIDATNGRIRWRARQRGTSLAAPLLRSDEVVISYGSQAGTIVRGLSIEDGHRVWTHRPTADFGVALVNEDASRFAYRDAGWRVLAFDAAGSSARADSSHDRDAMRVPVFGDACLVGNTLVMLERGALVRVDVSGASPSIDRRTLSPPDTTIPVSTTCGRRGDDFVFFGNDVSNGLPGEAHLLVVGPGGEVRRRIDLGSGELFEIGGERDREHPRSHPLRGFVSAFVPIAIHRGESEFELVVIDLDHGTIAWTSPRHQELLHYQIVRGHRDVHYLSRSGHIVALDGRNGHVLAATVTSGRGIRGFYATGGALWETAEDWRPVSALPFVTLDSRSLVRLAGPDPELPRHHDDLSRTLSWLAVPNEYRR